MKQQSITYTKDKDCTINTPVTLGLPNTPIYGTGKRIKPRYPGNCDTGYQRSIFLPELLPLEQYDRIILLLSGGKDSVVALWKLIELGVPREKIELWHHSIDGGHPERRMDWPVTQAYINAFSEAVGVPLRTSWRVNGFFGELYRIGASYPIEYEDNGVIKTCRLSPKQQRSEELRELILQGICTEEELQEFGHRYKFPAKSGDLSRRWCSANLKTDVAKSVICNLNWLNELHSLGDVGKFPAKGGIHTGRWCSPQLKREVADNLIRHFNELKELGSPRHKFPAKGSSQSGRWCSGSLKAQIQDRVTVGLDNFSENINILVVSGERRGESPGRALYNEIEIHRTNAVARAKRLVHQWRAVIDYSERDIWAVLQRYGSVPHPCYSIGWSRCSCMMCIFSEPRHWAGIRELFPDDYEKIRKDEIELGFTIDNTRDLDTYVGDAQSCVDYSDDKAIRQTLTGEFEPTDIFIAPYLWRIPAGAFKGSGGGPC